MVAVVVSVALAEVQPPARLSVSMLAPGLQLHATYSALCPSIHLSWNFFCGLLE